MSKIEVEKAESVEFKWKKKRGDGKRKNGCQFYESFVYDGTDYNLYDCVYLYKEGEREPYVGKLIKMWELPDMTKELKILWFFRPSEISNWLGDAQTLENELFLASGEGVGLTNKNLLEAIAGKCNVVCTSKDSRNPQPSLEELQVADFIFHRTFDVGHCKILDKIDKIIAGVEEGHLALDKTTLRSKVDSDKTEGKVNEILDDDSSQNVKSCGIAIEEGHVADDTTSLRSKVDSDNIERNVNEILVNKIVGKQKVKPTENISVLDGRPFGKANINTSLSEEKRRNGVDKFDSDGKDVKTLAVDNSTQENTKSKRAKGSPGPVNGPSKRLKPDEGMPEPSDGKLVKTYPRESPKDGGENKGQLLEVTRRLNADSIRWFKGPPWEERMQTAHKQGKLVLLENLDPAYTSAEVEDIVWCGFNESCTAKMMQRTAISSPHCGQAYVIFKGRDAAEMVIRKLEEECLMLSNGRPLLGSFSNPSFPERHSSFAGHLSIDKAKLLALREEKRQAVSTSHCSQPNTIEYEMAMEWCFLQERSVIWWKHLYKTQGEQLRELEADLKSE